MNNKNKLIFCLIILAIGASFILWYGVVGHKKGGDVALVTPGVVASSASSSPFPSFSKSPVANQNKKTGQNPQSITPQEIQNLLNKQYLIPTTVPYEQLTKPAACQVQGKLKFWSPNGYQTLGAKISYTGVDSPARQIKWKVSPTGEDLGVGPNLMAQLKLPDGENPISAVLPPSPHSKNYILTAAITYGRLVDGGVKVYEALCAGQASIELDY